jgi:hypothetical protein
MPTVISTDHSRTVIPNTPPANWEREIPMYRVTIKGGVYPSPNSRFRFEPPFTSCTDSNCWQFAERPFQEGEIIETTEWPHASFRPLNYSAKKILDFFNSRQKSRLPRSPWADGRVRLDDGLSGDLPKIIAPKVAPINRDAWPDL